MHRYLGQIDCHRFILSQSTVVILSLVTLSGIRVGDTVSPRGSLGNSSSPSGSFNLNIQVNLSRLMKNQRPSQLYRIVEHSIYITKLIRIASDPILQKQLFQLFPRKASIIYERILFGIENFISHKNTKKSKQPALVHAWMFHGFDDSL